MGGHDVSEAGEAFGHVLNAPLRTVTTAGTTGEEPMSTESRSASSRHDQVGTTCDDQQVRCRRLDRESVTDCRCVVLVSDPEVGDFDAHGPYHHLVAIEVADLLRAELDSYGLPEVQVRVARLLADETVGGPTPGPADVPPVDNLDARIHGELDRPPVTTGRPADDLTELRCLEGRRNHALRAVLAECRVLDRDPDTSQLANDLRTVIAVALHLRSI